MADEDETITSISSPLNPATASALDQRDLTVDTEDSSGTSIGVQVGQLTPVLDKASATEDNVDGVTTNTTAITDQQESKTRESQQTIIKDENGNDTLKIASSADSLASKEPNVEISVELNPQDKDSNAPAHTVGEPSVQITSEISSPTKQQAVDDKHAELVEKPVTPTTDTDSSQELSKIQETSPEPTTPPKSSPANPVQPEEIIATSVKSERVEVTDIQSDSTEVKSVPDTITKTEGNSIIINPDDEILTTQIKTENITDIKSHTENILDPSVVTGHTPDRSAKVDHAEENISKSEKLTEKQSTANVDANATNKLRSVPFIISADEDVILSENTAISETDSGITNDKADSQVPSVNSNDKLRSVPFIIADEEDVDIQESISVTNEDGLVTKDDSSTLGHSEADSAKHELPTSSEYNVVTETIVDPDLDSKSVQSTKTEEQENYSLGTTDVDSDTPRDSTDKCFEAEDNAVNAEVPSNIPNKPVGDIENVRPVVEELSSSVPDSESIIAPEAQHTESQAHVQSDVNKTTIGKEEINHESIIEPTQDTTDGSESNNQDVLSVETLIADSDSANKTHSVENRDDSKAQSEKEKDSPIPTKEQPDDSDTTTERHIDHIHQEVLASSINLEQITIPDSQTTDTEKDAEIPEVWEQDTNKNSKANNEDVPSEESLISDSDSTNKANAVSNEDPSAVQVEREEDDPMSIREELGDSVTTAEKHIDEVHPEVDASAINQEETISLEPTETEKDAKIPDDGDIITPSDCSSSAEKCDASEVTAEHTTFNIEVGHQVNNENKIVDATETDELKHHDKTKTIEPVTADDIEKTDAISYNETVTTEGLKIVESTDFVEIVKSPDSLSIVEECPSTEITDEQPALNLEIANIDNGKHTENNATNTEDSGNVDKADSPKSLDNILGADKADIPEDSPSNSPADDSADAPTDAPVDDPADTPADAVADGPTDRSTDALADAVADGPTDGPTDVLADGPTDGPADVPADGPADVPADGPVGGPIDSQADDLADVPIDSLADELADNPTDGPRDSLADGSVDGRAITPADDRPVETTKELTGDIADHVTDDITCDMADDIAHGVEDSIAIDQQLSDVCGRNTDIESADIVDVHIDSDTEIINIEREESENGNTDTVEISTTADPIQSVTLDDIATDGTGGIAEKTVEQTSNFNCAIPNVDVLASDVDDVVKRNSDEIVVDKKDESVDESDFNSKEQPDNTTIVGTDEVDFKHEYCEPEDSEHDEDHSFDNQSEIETSSDTQQSWGNSLSELQIKESTEDIPIDESVIEEKAELPTQTEVNLEKNQTIDGEDRQDTKTGNGMAVEDAEHTSLTEDEAVSPTEKLTQNTENSADIEVDSVIDIEEDDMEKQVDDQLALQPSGGEVFTDSGEQLEDRLSTGPIAELEMESSGSRYTLDNISNIDEQNIAETNIDDTNVEEVDVDVDDRNANDASLPESVDWKSCGSQLSVSDAPPVDKEAVSLSFILPRVIYVVKTQLSRIL